jgi:hypothetical protein
MQQFLDFRPRDGGEIVILTRRPHFTSKEFSCYSFLFEAENPPPPRSKVLLEGSDKLIKSSDLNKTGNGDHPAYSTAP